MEAFESMVAAILQSHGFWVRTSVKVEMTREQKREINRPSSPRWEIDVVAYRPSDNELWVVECKSYLDSQGVKADAFVKTGHSGAKRYKLFTEDTTRKVVMKALIQQLRKSKALHGRPRVRLCLVAGHIARQSESTLKKHFSRKGWKLFGQEWLREELLRLAGVGYQNDVATITVKLLQKKLTENDSAR